MENANFHTPTNSNAVIQMNPVAAKNEPRPGLASAQRWPATGFDAVRYNTPNAIGHDAMARPTHLRLLFDGCGWFTYPAFHLLRTHAARTGEMGR